MKNYYYTGSLNMASWLYSKGFEIINITKLDKAVLYFDRSEELEKSIEEYNKNLELKKFITAFKEVKQQIKIQK